mgnify:CR=1 FL=1
MLASTKPKSLTAAFVSSVKEPGKYHDGKGTGLFLLVKPSGARSWVQRIVVRGKRREIGLGSARFLSLAEARELAFANKKVASMGGDPTPYEGYTNVYLQNNIHGYTKAARGGKTEYIASYANYVQPDTGHFFVPVNTAVSVGKWRGGFTLTRQDNGQMIYFEYRSGNMGDMSV